MTADRVEPIVVVLTALDLEYQAVLAHLRDPVEVEHSAGTLFEVGRLPGSPGLVAVGLTTAGNNAAAALAERAVAHFQPEALLFVGVAGALRDRLKTSTSASDPVHHALTAEPPAKQWVNAVAGCPAA